jgi:hypothetical protein
MNVFYGVRAHQLSDLVVSHQIAEKQQKGRERLTGNTIGLRRQKQHLSLLFDVNVDALSPDPQTIDNECVLERLSRKQEGDRPGLSSKEVCNSFPCVTDLRFLREYQSNFLSALFDFEQDARFVGVLRLRIIAEGWGRGRLGWTLAH